MAINSIARDVDKCTLRTPYTFRVPSATSTKNWSVSQIGYGWPFRWKKRTVKVIVPPTICGSIQSHATVQFAGNKYFPVTYCSSELRASGAKDGCVIAANVTRPATETVTTNTPPIVHASWCSLDFTIVDHKSAFNESNNDLDVGNFCRAFDHVSESFPSTFLACASSSQYTSSSETTWVDSNLQ